MVLDYYTELQDMRIMILAMKVMTRAWMRSCERVVVRVSLRQVVLTPSSSEGGVAVRCFPRGYLRRYHPGWIWRRNLPPCSQMRGFNQEARWHGLCGSTTQRRERRDESWGKPTHGRRIDEAAPIVPQGREHQP